MSKYSDLFRQMPEPRAPWFDPTKLLKLKSNPMTTEEYFTPSIEDIRVGYECEINPTININPENWNKLKIAQVEQIKRITEAPFSIRVPYLTKEQIEAEGWKARGSEGYYYKKCNKVVYLPNNNNIMLITQFTERPLENEIFKGECKDINTFRYICKLLGI